MALFMFFFYSINKTDFIRRTLPNIGSAFITVYKKAAFLHSLKMRLRDVRQTKYDHKYDHKC